MKIFKSGLFGDVPEPTSFQEIMDFAFDPAPDAHRAVRMWRGQADIDWPLHSTAYRRLCKGYLVSGSKTPTEKDLQFYERGLLKSADHKGYRYQDGRRLADFELLARLRHHGAATRLVDATRNVLVGLWFCAASEPNKTGLLVGIHAHYVGGYEGRSEERDYDDVLKSLANLGHPVTWEPAPNSPRIASQHSQFLYSAVATEQTGSLLLPKTKACVLFLAITPSLKQKLLIILSEVFDIRRATLFPDFDGFSSSFGTEIKPSDDHRW